MYSQPVREVMEHERLLTAAPDISVREAARLMAKRGVGAVMVVERGNLVGIFTERDLVLRVVAQDRDVRATRLAEVMTPSPQTVDPGKSFGYALLMMQENGFRHVPVVEDGRVIGMVSVRSALDPDLEEYVVESKRRRQIQSEGP
jgi:CBS domain-containing protein